MIITSEEFRTLAAIAFRLLPDGSPAYAGYRPQIVEAPNGDGKLDTQKRYAHISLKNLRAYDRPFYCSFSEAVEHGNEMARMQNALHACHAEALRVHAALGLPEAWAPDLDASALRLLEYPPGATSARHTDFDLFTLVAYRDPYPGGLVRYVDAPDDGRNLVHVGNYHDIANADDISPGIHFGELYELGGFGRATPHEVVAVEQFRDVAGVDDYPIPQVSAVFFALPRHDLVLPDGRKVGPQTEPGTYLHERMSRSRIAR